MPDTVHLDSIDEISRAFMPPEHGPGGDDLYPCMTPFLKPGLYRALHADEIATLVKNNNYAESWAEIFVTGAFKANLIVNCEFYGRVLIGDLTPRFIEYHDLRLPVGIRNSTIMSCRIGDNVAIRDVHYLAHYVIGNDCILFNVNEMLCTNHAKFGNGIVKEGESEEVRVWLEVANENGGRRILPFEGLITADAYLWSKHRADDALMRRLVEITENGFSGKRGFWGEVGDGTVIKDCRIIKDVRFGSRAYVKGANKLKNLTVLSSPDEPSQIGEGTELVNGIIGYGSRVFYGVKAVRFVAGRCTQLKYGARLINSVLGDNSTVSCCELLNNLIFPFHEQHHNNSFLIATTLMGQSNIAAGATIGSNHNTRAPDGEIVAGRGFWPGLCADFKHNCRFASFVLAAKGSYAHELDIPFPFSLMSLRTGDDRVRVTPGYWFANGTYALARNEWKFRLRDRRAVKVQNIEIEYLAPDTVQEMLSALGRLESLAGRTALESDASDGEPIVDPSLMKRYGGVIEKPARGWRLYREFCSYFGIKTLLDRLGIDSPSGGKDFAAQAAAFAKRPLKEAWINLGGQVMASSDLESIQQDIKSGALDSWDAVHARYAELWSGYPEDKARYAIHVLESIRGKAIASFSASDWKELLAKTRETFSRIYESALKSRKKDYEDPFRKSVYDSESEMIAVLGRIEENPFLGDLKARTDAYLSVLDRLVASI